MDLRDRLRRADAEYFDTFVDLTARLTPLLASIEEQFPDYTRHDPSHNERLEAIAAELLKGEVKDALSAADLFVLLSALWLHDAGMGVYTPLDSIEKAKPEFAEKLARFERLGRSPAECWRDHVRENHHRFCVVITNDLLDGRANPSLVHWIGAIGRSHGERGIHERTVWPSCVAVSESEEIHPPLLAAVLRLADVMHFSRDHAPDYMLEHRHIKNVVSVEHWHAHQVAAGHTIADDICCFDGVTQDDEAYWFAQQFFDAMEDELKYCKSDVLPNLDPPFANALTFSQIERRINARDFSPGRSALTVRVDAPKLLEDLLNDALYAGKPAWFRELLQNAFDACRDLAFRDADSTPSVAIVATTEPEQLSLADTGVGMRRRTVEQFLFVASASFWSSDEYRADALPHAGHVGRFGIGFMSVFAVADEVIVETRHVSETHGWRFLIRSSRRTVRVEQIDRASSGTTIKLRLRRGTLEMRDPVDLSTEICPYPEFPLSLEVDGTLERSHATALVPNAGDEGFELQPMGQPEAQARVFVREISEDGIHGVLQMPKIVLRQLDAAVPDMRGWLRKAGWTVTGESRTYYGGIAYPALHALSTPAGFTHIPSMGNLRLAVSPNRYPLEMNLARDNFAAGEGTLALFRSVARIMDGLLGDDLEEELGRQPDAAKRSTIAGFYSWTMLELRAGSVPSLSTMALSQPSGELRAISPTPWLRINNVMEQSLLVETFDVAGNRRSESVKSLVDAGAIVFAVGGTNGILSTPLLRAIFAFSPEAKVVFALPGIGFGLVQMRHWACEEFLVPVPEHGRSAFGIRLARSARPFSFFPRESERFGLPVASGPERYALLDYRDMMAEVSTQPTGASKIVAVLNRRNPKIAMLLARLNTFASSNALRRELRGTLKEWRKRLVVGDANQYSGGAGSLVSALNSAAAMIGTGPDLVRLDELPAYMNSGSVTPYGRPFLDELTIAAHQEVNRFDFGFPDLA